MSICEKLQSAKCRFPRRGSNRETSRKETYLPTVQTSSELKVTRPLSRVLSLYLYPVDPVVLTSPSDSLFTLARPSA